MQFDPMPYSDRIRWALYAFAGGLFVGLILGWVFHGLVGLFVRFFVILALLVPFIVAFLFWRRVSGGRRPRRPGEYEAGWRESGGSRPGRS